MIIIALLISLFLAVDAHALDKKLVSTNCFKMVITDTSGNGIAGLDAATPFDDFEVKVKCGSDSIITLNEAGDTIVDEGGGVYYYCTDDTLTTTNENECVVWTVGEGNYSLATNPVTSLLAKNPLKFKAVAVTVGVLTPDATDTEKAAVASTAIKIYDTGNLVATNTRKFTGRCLEATVSGNTQRSMITGFGTDGSGNFVNIKGFSAAPTDGSTLNVWPSGCQ